MQIEGMDLPFIWDKIRASEKSIGLKMLKYSRHLMPLTDVWWSCTVSNVALNFQMVQRFA